MRIKSIAALCAAQDKVILINRDNGEQWVSDGIGAYPLSDIPYVGMDALLSIFDFAQAKRGKVTTQVLREDELRILLEGDDNGEGQLIPASVSIGPDGGAIPMFSSRGLLFISAAHLKPIKDALPYATYILHTDNAGQPYITVRIGMFEIAAVLCPMINCKDWFLEGIRSLEEQAHIAKAQGYAEGIIEIDGTPPKCMSGSAAGQLNALEDDADEEDPPENE